VWTDVEISSAPEFDPRTVQLAAQSVSRPYCMKHRHPHDTHARSAAARYAVTPHRSILNVNNLVLKILFPAPLLQTKHYLYGTKIPTKILLGCLTKQQLRDLPSTFHFHPTATYNASTAVCLPNYSVYCAHNTITVTTKTHNFRATGNYIEY